MPIRVLGCSGSIAASSRTTSFLLDDDILIDAGTGVGDLPLEALERIDHVLISHSHLDHVVSIALLADSVMRLRRQRGAPPVQVHALPATLAALKAHIFNGVIWPDFTALPDADAPTLAFAPFDIGQRLALGRRLIEVLPAQHVVPAVGFAVWPDAHGSGAAWVYSGDTGPNPALWQRLSGMAVDTLVIETAFRDEERAVAERSMHLYPQRLREELAQLTGAADVYITHVKPGEVQHVMGQIGAHASHHRIQALVAGQCMAVGAADC